MIHNLFRAVTNLLPKAKKPAPQLTPKVWFKGGKATQHTSQFITKQAPRGFKFPK